MVLWSSLSPAPSPYGETEPILFPAREPRVAKFQVMYWKHIPSQVKAWEGDIQAKRMLPDYFQAAIDAYAMKDGSTEIDAYLDGWHWADAEERDGTPDEVIEVVVQE